MPVLKVFFHDACFDGTASAALFTAFYRDVIAADASVAAVGMTHKDGNPFDGVPLDADDHACVDFRFCPDPRMKWWFDHHPTAFQPETLRDVFERQHQPTWFFDPKSPSCAGLIRRALEQRYNWTAPAHLQEVVAWADTIDAAQFATAQDAIALVNPAQRLAAWLAHGRQPAETATYVEWLSRASLAEIAERPDVKVQLQTIDAERAAEMDAVTKLGVWAGETVVFDRFAELGARSPGFLGYVLFPTALYAVSGTRNASSIKISVGVNPWAGKPRRHDIGELCARHGGGGHAVVGGVTLRGDEVERARATLAAIVRELQT